MAKVRILFKRVKCVEDVGARLGVKVISSGSKAIFLAMFSIFPVASLAMNKTSSQSTIM